MTMVIDINSKVQAELTRQAAERGLEIAAYAAILLEKAALSTSKSNIASESDLDRTLHELAQFSDKIPALPDQAFSRENLYPDHV